MIKKSKGLLHIDVLTLIQKRDKHILQTASIDYALSIFNLSKMHSDQWTYEIAFVNLPFNKI